MKQGTLSDFTTDKDRWRAVAGRLTAADDSFVYAVRTTGVYCRPGCASRQPNRKNVEFFGTCQKAELAGYRPCKKCRPQLPDRPDGSEAVVRACSLIESATEPLSLSDLAQEVGLSPHYFHRLFKQAVGVTPKAYAAARRDQRFRKGLLENPTITGAIYDAGFRSSSRCYDGTASNLGMTPSQYKQGGAGVRIRFAVVECSLGWLLVAATERGIAVIEFGDSPLSLRKRLAAQFPRAELREGDADFGEWVAKVLAFVERPRRGLALPLDIQGTAFQRRVWQALQSIPPGKTATYSDVAKKIGAPSAVRAVARACASNSVAVAIPCHRVVGRGGKLTGYRWGIERKQALLDRESQERKDHTSKSRAAATTPRRRLKVKSGGKL